MSEKAPGYRHDIPYKDELQKDPEAPSVSEIIDTLKTARESIIGWVDDGRGMDASDFDEVMQIDNLIYRLEEQ